ncbi:hypothetical protein AUEXF2481DRAFT_4918 [Aureobasidium subglaciale EXF-2481]|uniref:C2H2-type domain-containing protein n=1 Tax=Aureobasidium subglaciale (strain EXF-2481) TaxID=1043005 RepID=A0A074YC36_AURSE|nr:uncharacterized protein AUEXF2481DRAFT_4918 [Aureobasidium subglaciale EXF-2481]KAI5195813.1 hypothetical protein E4T38_08869 [Aureobasidium subglaciale]KAI5214781.1 hypothetical protein E4T40_08826 [Aureobasidium subglaciale]KAI5217706.1 hypothetical protein E4T41_08736 [Aureobasidium subglaciale]KAI5255351.1 hypothetical protein E4T46_08770 [Aureobasidium subglaciale]KEQ95300.1 hypothetical protein AUEXF2481DRAFT_4918 [Aureobasidium subglaciale EXF-2481]
MAPYNSHYDDRYDPVGSRYNQQTHQTYYAPGSQQPAQQQQQQQPSTTQTPQPQPPAPPGHQTSYAAGYSNRPYYNDQSTESRAAETLSHLSAQDKPTTSNRSSNSQYDTSSRADSSWNTSDRPSANQHESKALTNWHNADRRPVNPSPLYQQDQRPNSTTNSYSPAQSYSQPANNPSTYSYPSYSQSDQPRAPTITASQPTSYDYSSSSFRPASPYLARQSQQSGAHRSSTSSQTSTAPRDHHLTAAASHTSANVGQPRAPSVAPTSIRANSSYAHQSNPPDQAYSSAPTTVDPVQVYDPWPEQQRKLAEARRKAEAEEERRAEEEAKIKAEEEAKRKAEEEVKRKVEEEARKKAEEEARRMAEEEARIRAAEEAKRRAEEEAKRKIEEERRADEKRKEEAKKAESSCLAREVANQEEAKRRHYRNMQEQQPSTSAAQRPASNVIPAVTTVHDTQRKMAAAMANLPSAGAGSSNLETEMAAFLRRMRDLNQADPRMFARMWETERQVHLPQSVSATQAPAQPPPQVPAAILTPAQRAQGPARPVFNPAPAEAPQAPIVPTPHSATAGPNSNAASNARKQTVQANISAATPSGGPNTIWPPGKKATLAETAIRWLNARKENTNKLVSVEAIHALLAPNPSYMTLCESLERMGLYVDRAQFARALLSVVPDAAKANQNKPASPSITQAQPSMNATASASTASVQVTPQSGSASKKYPNIGRFPGRRGRPSRAAVAALQEKGVIDLTGRDSVPPTTSTPRVSQPYHAAAHPTDAPTVNYQSEFHYAPPADDVPEYASSYTPPQHQRQFQPRPQHQLQQHMQQQQMQSQQQQAAAVQSLQGQHRNYSSLYFQQQGQAHNAARSTPPSVGPRPPSANKGEAARKRNFAELVDMTAMNSDSEEDVPPAKQANTAQYDMASTSEQSGNVHSNGHFNPGMPINLQQSYFNGTVYPTYLPSNAPQPSAAVASRPMVISKHVELKNQTLVEPVRRAKVARKSRYDPKTICRDVLLATGRHPDMRPLNQHLNVMHNFLKNHSEGVDQDKFDLESIRWDLIDPGEPIIEPLETAEADRESTVPEVEVMNERSATDADDEGGSEDEGGARLTSDAPAPVTVTDAAFTTETTPAPPSSARRASTQVVAVEIKTSRGQRFTRKPFPKAKVGWPRKSMPVVASTSVGDGKTPAKPTRRHTDIHQRATSSIATDTPRNQQTQKMSATPVPGQPIGYSAFRSTQVDENGKPIKRRGRPVGWRKSVHSKAALAAAAGGGLPVSSAPKPSAAQRQSRGQPSYAPPKQRRTKQAKPVVENKEPEIEFNVYKCDWEDCGSELHNIDTLRKHVLKLHGKKTSEGDYECAWFGCFQEEEVTAFDDLGSWMEHMENVHVKPLSKTLGDGPRSGLSDHHSEKSGAYLSDSFGRQVTPIISMARVQKGTREWEVQQAREADARRLSTLTGSRLNDEKLLQQMEEKKRVVGPALTKAGSRLWTEERKRNFLHDEYFYEVLGPAERLNWPSPY